MYLEFRDFDQTLLKRPNDGNRDIEKTVGRIIDEVREHGDEALREYALKFDGSQLDNLYADEAEFREAEKAVPENLKWAINHAMRNIRKFWHISPGRKPPGGTGMSVWRCRIRNYCRKPVTRRI